MFALDTCVSVVDERNSNCRRRQVRGAHSHSSTHTQSHVKQKTPFTDVPGSHTAIQPASQPHLKRGTEPRRPRDRRHSVLQNTSQQHHPTKFVATVVPPLVDFSLYVCVCVCVQCVYLFVPWIFMYVGRLWPHRVCLASR